jgi:DNA-binding GntR family transcriptional regulator
MSDTMPADAPPLLPRTRPGQRGGRAPRRVSQTQRAYDELKSLILDNVMPAGTQALEQEVARRLNMSRTPVREALIRLAQEGMVEVRPRHGMRVLPVSVADMREIYEILASLEAAAAGAAARQGIGPRHMAALEQAVIDMEAALQRDDRAAWAAGDAAFHRLLVEASGNRRLMAMVEAVRDQSHRVRMVTLQLRPRPVNSNRDHAEVLQAIRDRDEETAYRVHRRHRVEAGRLLIALLEQHGLDHL